MVSFEEYSLEAAKTRLQPQNIPPVALWALKLNGEAGEVAEKVGKFFRDGGLLDDRQLIKELGDVLWYIDAIAAAVGSSLGEVAYQNIAKLKDRYQRGTIGGSGDER